MSTKIYLACTWDNGYDQGWVAVTEHGEKIASHISSGRGWGLEDVGPTGFYRDKYPEDFEVVEVPHGESLPEAVLAAWALWDAYSETGS